MLTMFSLHIALLSNALAHQKIHRHDPLIMFVSMAMLGCLIATTELLAL